MKKPLQILIVEDNPVDAKLLLAELRAAGFEPSWKRVETESDFLAELENSPDIILSDYSMPEFSGLRAAELLAASGRKIPFILISGVMGEEVAVEAMKQGITDYLLKDRITRLGNAVERALRETQAVRERLQTEEALRLLGTAIEQSNESVVITDARLDFPGPAIVFVNPGFTRMTGYTAEESLGKSPRMLQGPRTDKAVMSRLRKNLEQGERFFGEAINYRKDGTEFDIEWQIDPVRNTSGEITHFVTTQRNITERKTRERELSRANRALRLLSASNASLIRAESELELLERICRIATESGGYCMAWVGYAQDDEARSIKPMAYAGAEKDCFSEVEISWQEDDPLGQGPAGQVIRTGRSVTCTDLTGKSKFGPCHSPAAQCGFRRGTFLPLSDGRRTFGVLGLYCADVDDPGPEEVELLQELADNLAFGIGHLNSHLDQQRLQTAVLQVAAGVSGASGSEFFEHFARHMADAVGAQAGFVSKFNAGEPLSATTLVAVVDGKVVENFNFPIEATPCENLATTDLFVVIQNAAGKFPQARELVALGAQGCIGRRLDDSAGRPLGILHVVFRKPLTDVGFVTSNLQIFAARAASELERQQTDAQVREQAALIDEAREAIVVRDLEHRITFWSKGAERIFGWSAENAQGNLLQELLEGDPATFARAIRSVWESGAWNGEIQQRTRNRTLLTLNSRWTLMRGPDGKPHSILSIDTDITEQKKIEAQFLRAQRMESIGTLAGGIAHDLNNALSPIMMALEVLAARFTDPTSAELLSILIASTQRGAEMVRQVLSFARGVESRRLELPLGQIIEEIEKIAKDTFLKHVEVNKNIPQDLWAVAGDPTQIHQVLLNLCVNARDAMPGGGTITISAENRQLDVAYAAENLEAKAGPYVCLKVSDTGSGIPPAMIEKIFDPFFTTKEVGKGTGLGLSTSLAIVTSHGGYFRVDSAPEKGTTFEVYLPAQPEVTVSTRAGLTAEIPRGQGELILAVDDEESVRMITEITLVAFGYRVLLASDGAAAIALYRSHQAEIAAVITDMTMPKLNGIATIQALRKIDPQVRIIAVSGLPLSDSVASTCGLDMKHFIPKPYTGEAMLRLLQQVLAERGQQA